MVQWDYRKLVSSEASARGTAADVEAALEACRTHAGGPLVWRRESSGAWIALDPRDEGRYRVWEA